MDTPRGIFIAVEVKNTTSLVPKPGLDATGWTSVMSEPHSAEEQSGVGRKAPRHRKPQETARPEVCDATR